MCINIKENYRLYVKHWRIAGHIINENKQTATPQGSK